MTKKSHFENRLNLNLRKLLAFPYRNCEGFCRDKIRIILYLHQQYFRQSDRSQAKYDSLCKTAFVLFTSYIYVIEIHNFVCSLLPLSDYVYPTQDIMNRKDSVQIRLTK